MSLQYVIDAYNIINSPSFAPVYHQKLKNPPKTLLEFIIQNRLQGSPRNKVILVFDGYPCAQDCRFSAANCEVIFSGAETADEKIKKIIGNSDTPKNIVLITDDKEVIFFAKSCGSRVLSTEEFCGSKEKTKKARRAEKELAKPELNFTQIDRINKELKELWLK